MRLGRNFTIVLHSAHWHSETDWNIAVFLFLLINRYDFSASHRNFVRFGSVTPDFYRNQLVCMAPRHQSTIPAVVDPATWPQISYRQYASSTECAQYRYPHS